MKHEKFIVKIPIPESDPVEYKEFRFFTREEVCNFLNIRLCTFNRICNGTIQYAHADTMRLYGIVIERIEDTKPTKLNKSEASALFARQLLSNAK